MGNRLFLSLSLLICASCVLDQRAVGPGRSLDGGAGGDGGGGGSAGSAGSGGAAGSSGSGGSAGAGGVGGNVIGSECTVETEDADCNGMSCNPVTLECTHFEKWASGTCEACVSDENCSSWSHRCVPMFFDDNRFPDDHTGFCLPEAKREFVGAPYDCNGEGPYVMVLHERVSMSGTEISAYCGPREDLTTCHAVIAQLDELGCTAERDDECPTGGLCRYTSDNGKWDYRCTYACTSNSECANRQGWELDCGGYCGT